MSISPYSRGSYTQDLPDPPHTSVPLSRRTPALSEHQHCRLIPPTTDLANACHGVNQSSLYSDVFSRIPFWSPLEPWNSREEQSDCNIRFVTPGPPIQVDLTEPWPLWSF